MCLLCWNEPETKALNHVSNSRSMGQIWLIAAFLWPSRPGGHINRSIKITVLSLNFKKQDFIWITPNYTSQSSQFSQFCKSSTNPHTFSFWCITECIWNFLQKYWGYATALLPLAYWMSNCSSWLIWRVTKSHI